MKRVTVGKTYTYQAVGLDMFDARTDLVDGEKVRVVNLRGCPPANTMGHCYVEPIGREDGRPRLVLTNSLQK